MLQKQNNDVYNSRYKKDFVSVVCVCVCVWVYFLCIFFIIK